MKIAHLISNYFPSVGGAQVCIHHIANRLIEKGHQAVVITPAASQMSDRSFKYEILKVNPLLNRFLFTNFSLGKIYLENILAKMQSNYNFDIWQVTFGYPLGAASADFFNRNNLPCILRCTGEDLQTAPDLKYGYRLKRGVDSAVRDNYRKFTACIALSDSMKKDYLSLGIPDEKVSVIPNGVDCSRFAITVDKEKIKKEYGIDASYKLIITVGRNHPKKGFVYIPEIIKRLLEKRSDFRWLLVGKDSTKIKALAEKAGVGEYLIATEINPSLFGKGEFEVPSAELIKLYKASDVFVFPTFIETFGKVIAEAMAAGLPIVTTDAPGARDIIRDGENGLKSKAGDVNALAESILKIFSDEALAKYLGQNALRDAKMYDWSGITDMYLELYERATGQKDVLKESVA